MKICGAIRGTWFTTFESGVKSSVVTINGQENPFSTGENVFVESVNIRKQERIGHLPCFGGRNIVYSFGMAVESNTAEVGFTAFLEGPCDNNGPTGVAVTNFLDWFNENRLSVTNSTATITVGGKVASKGVVSGISVNSSSAELNLVSGIIYLSFVE